MTRELQEKLESYQRVWAEVDLGKYGPYERKHCGEDENTGCH